MIDNLTSQRSRTCYAGADINEMDLDVSFKTKDKSHKTKVRKKTHYPRRTAEGKKEWDVRPEA